MSQTGDKAASAATTAVLAWLITSIFYLYQYVLRSAPAVMMPELTHAFGISAVELASLLGLFYYGYAVFSLVAGIALDQLGARKVVPVGAACVGLGAVLFAMGDPTAASIGRFFQGAGGAFSMIGAAYIAGTYFPASRAASLIGATQMFGMAGGAAGQFLVGPAIAGGLPWDRFWTLMALAGLMTAILLLFFVPRNQMTSSATSTRVQEDWVKRAVAAFGAVFRNPQSILCGLIAGLLFLPTTIFDMLWGVRFLQEAHDVDYSLAVLRSASVPFGWIIGSPLLGLLSDRIGRRKPVIIGSAVVLLISFVLILYGPPGLFPAYSLGLVTGVASGGAMLPYTVIKEANRPEHGGTATGVINFINFTLSALLGPVFGTLLTRVSGGAERELIHYQTAFAPLGYGIALAVVLTLFLRETGPATRTAKGAPKSAPESHTKGRPAASH